MNTPTAPAGVGIAAARRDDLAAILALERAGFAEDEQWSDRSWSGELLGEGRTVLLARAEQVLGVIALRSTGEAADLHRLVVAPGHRRLGIGAALVRAGLETLRAQGVRAVLLEVDYANEPAIALYQRLGFEQLSARRDYYGPGQHALILKLYDLEGWPGRLAAQAHEEEREQAEQEQAQQEQPQQPPARVAPRRPPSAPQHEEQL